MADDFADHASSLDAPATRHWLLSANPDADINPRPRAIYCHAAGTITLSDDLGSPLPYSLTAGAFIPFRGKRVTAISGGTFYGWS